MDTFACFGFLLPGLHSQPVKFFPASQKWYNNTSVKICKSQMPTMMNAAENPWEIIISIPSSRFSWFAVTTTRGHLLNSKDKRSYWRAVSLSQLCPSCAARKPILFLKLQWTHVVYKSPPTKFQILTSSSKRSDGITPGLDKAELGWEMCWFTIHPGRSQ